MTKYGDLKEGEEDGERLQGVALQWISVTQVIYYL